MTTTNNPRLLLTTANKHRSKTVKYYLPKDGVNVRVCKKFFASTLCVGKKVIDHALRVGYGAPDRRGKHANRRNRISIEDRQNVKKTH